LAAHEKALVVVVAKGFAHPSLPEIFLYIAADEQEAEHICEEFLMEQLVGWRLQLFDPKSFDHSYPFFLLQKSVTSAYVLTERHLGVTDWMDEPFSEPSFRDALEAVVRSFSESHELKNDAGVVMPPWFLFQESRAYGVSEAH
jgi:hypothetical protein